MGKHFRSAIVEATFLHYQGTTCDQAIIEGWERKDEECPPFTTLRLIDARHITEAKVVSCAHTVDSTERIAERYVQASTRDDRPAMKKLAKEYASMEKYLQKMRERMHEHAIDMFMQAFRYRKSIARWCYDIDEFQILRRDELYDLVSPVRRSRGVTLTIFRGSNLCGNPRETVASMKTTE